MEWLYFCDYNGLGRNENHSSVSPPPGRAMRPRGPRSRCLLMPAIQPRPGWKIEYADGVCPATSRGATGGIQASSGISGGRAHDWGGGICAIDATLPLAGYLSAKNRRMLAWPIVAVYFFCIKHPSPAKMKSIPADLSDPFRGRRGSPPEAMVRPPVTLLRRIRP